MLHTLSLFTGIKASYKPLILMIIRHTLGVAFVNGSSNYDIPF